MKRIHIYEAEPGDYRFWEADEWEDYTEVGDAVFDYLTAQDAARKELNKRLEELKKMEIDPWDEEAPTK